jgi:hypothetical protein
MKRWIALGSVLMFMLVTTAGFAANEKWFVIKDKNGVCRVISAEDKTPKTILGPYSTKKEAYAAKEKSCPSAKTSTKSTKKSKDSEKAQTSKPSKKSSGSGK